MKIIYLPFTVIAFCFTSSLVSCGGKKEENKMAPQANAAKRPAPSVEGFVVSTQTVSQSIQVPGTIVAEESTQIHPEVSGRITGLYIREGAIVSKGTTIAKLYDADLQAQRRKLAVQLQIAEQTETRHEQLLKIGGISREDYNNTTLQVSNIRADLDVINTEIAKTVVRAPFTGKVGLKAVSVGAYVTPQTVITSIQKTDGLRVDFNIPEKYSPVMKPGRYVNFTTEGSNRNYTGVVIATESGIEQTTRTLTIRAQVKGDQVGLVPGGFAKVNIDFDPNTKALMVPTQAVVPQARGKQVAVYRGGTAEFVSVTTGVRDSANVEIVSGLNQGDTVITTGLLSVKPNAKVRMGKVASHQR